MRASGRAASAPFWMGQGRARSRTVNAQPSAVFAKPSTAALTLRATAPLFAETATSQTGFVAPCAFRNS